MCNDRDELHRSVNYQTRYFVRLSEMNSNMVIWLCVLG